ncbi:hypothetical protein [Stigmatella aurantiaca]|uniref:Conserved uncharacterized protein n=1 Tax=Stigmatella aurantiaca (strain DW4/3-1) TaxID=378806 RepID=Q08NP1_STIAD|nr:hypothetical protein [Stigmatella aurantiaca]ADO72213.1 conserved uncharacterized protein [Stigmatella aurantiaca DW4/3-1]EAU62104.1 hypothetical protein STIAU_6659 [Stigmatella aurantiaca DW4/3-1]
MTPTQCPDLEVLFTELELGEGPSLAHATSCPVCSAVLEEHRQLEKDLYRLADPLPPPALVATVMARVAAEPPPLRRELWAGVSILAVSLSAGLGLLISNDRALSHLGLGLASLISDGKLLALDLANGGSALWNIAAGPITAILLSVLFVCLFGLKRLAGSPPPLTEA